MLPAMSSVPVGDEATSGVGVASPSADEADADPYDQQWCAGADVKTVFGDAVSADGSSWIVSLDSAVLPLCDDAAAQRFALRSWLKTGRCSSSAVCVAGPGTSRSRSRSPIGRRGWAHSSDDEASDGEISEAESAASSSPSSLPSASDWQMILPESGPLAVADAEADGSHAWRMSDSEHGQSESAGATDGAVAEADGAHA